MKQLSGVTLSIYVTGCITNIVKLLVGRPRPDFLSRCYPEGLPDHMDFTQGVSRMSCPGNEQLVLNGMKSFPSAHASLSFSSLGFVALYVGGKLRVFNRGRGQGWRFVSFVVPLMWALVIGVSRTSDYHHHWQDVTVGSIIGLVVGYACYHQVYPSLHGVHSHLCHSQVPSALESQNTARPEVFIPVSSSQPPPLQTDVTLSSKLI
ncbi:phospholipid phosphatase 5-like isoform X2 [Babylonia areolata]|uniref:phospholipid phosphatase 5-like isoform X2 n=1 Tax=Babylonia areolata TaxID=304850 RepID=UPI003FD66C2C